MRNDRFAVSQRGLCVGVIGFAIGGVAAADGPVVRDQSDLGAFTGEQCYTQIVANDFVVASTTRLTRASVWLTDFVNNDNNQLDGFAGELSWAIYEDASGPGEIIGFGRSHALVMRDTYAPKRLAPGRAGPAGF